MNSLVNTKSWIPVGNFLMLKPCTLDESTSNIVVQEEENGFEILGFGSSYDKDALNSAEIGDKVIIIENETKRSKGTLVQMQNEDVWFYPPSEIALLYKKDKSIVLQNGYILLTREDSEIKVGNLFIPASATNKNTHCTVAISSEIKDEDNLSLKPGDRVIVNKWAQNDITLNNKSYLLVKNSDIICRLKE